MEPARVVGRERHCLVPLFYGEEKQGMDAIFSALSSERKSAECQVIRIRVAGMPITPSNYEFQLRRPRNPTTGRRLTIAPSHPVRLPTRLLHTHHPLPQRGDQLPGRHSSSNQPNNPDTDRRLSLSYQWLPNCESQCKGIISPKVNSTPVCCSRASGQCLSRQATRTPTAIA